MTRQTAIEVLKDHQQWRKGQGKYSAVGVQPEHSAKEVSEAIDYAIHYLEVR